MEYLKKEVLKTARRMYSEALVSGSSGNVSVFDPEKKLMAITASGIDYTVMDKEDIIVTDLDGQIMSGRGEPSSEWRMHALIYEKRKDVFSIVHTHSPYATGFAVSHKPIPLILIEMVPFIGGAVPLAEFALPGTRDLGQKALDVLNDRNGCLLSNHGVLAIGTSLEEAYMRAVYIEDAAKIYLNARCTGETPYIIPEEIADKMK